MKTFSEFIAFLRDSKHMFTTRGHVIDFTRAHVCVPLLCGFAPID